jgi:hypothetical protein
MNPIDQLVADVAAEDTVIDSCVVYIKGVPALIDAAVQKALAGGATAAQLVPLTTLSADVKAKTQAITDALTANTQP